MKKLLLFVLSVFVLSMGLPILAAKPVDAGNVKEVRNEQVKVQVQEKQLERTESREESREVRSEKRQEEFEQKYNKKTAQVTRQFEKKLAVFEAHKTDESLIKAYTLLLEKIVVIQTRIEAQDVSDEIKQDRLDFLSALTESITAELAVLEANLADTTDGTGAVVTTGDVNTGAVVTTGDDTDESTISDDEDNDEDEDTEDENYDNEGEDERD
jgi:hypothetical protein